MKKSNTWINNSAFWIIATSILLSYRWIYRFTNATLWAEDGTIFLQQAIEHGSKSLIMPYAGYFHTVPRIIAFIASFLPTLIIPHFFVVICFIVTIYTLSILLKESYVWFIPDVYQRGILMLLIALSPGTTEAFGNLANLHWVLFLYLGFLGLKNPNIKFNLTELIIAALAITSEGATLILLPLFAIRLWFHVVNKRSKHFRFQEMGMVTFILLFAIVNFANKTDQSTTQLNIGLLMHVYLKTALCQFFSFAWVYTWPYQFSGYSWLTPTLCIAALAILILAKKFSVKETIFIPLLFFLCILLYPAMIAVARAANADLFLQSDWWIFMRYGFPAGVGGYIFWMWEISLLKTVKPIISKILCLLILILSFIFCKQNYFFIQPDKQANNWMKNAENIDIVRKDMQHKKITITIQPANWALTIGNGKDVIQPIN